MKTISNELVVWNHLTKIFKRRNAIEHWMSTYNILLDGECPEDLMKTEAGQLKVIALLRDMEGCP